MLGCEIPEVQNRKGTKGGLGPGPDSEKYSKTRGSESTFGTPNEEAETNYFNNFSTLVMLSDDDLYLAPLCESIVEYNLTNI